MRNRKKKWRIIKKFLKKYKNKKEIEAKMREKFYKEQMKFSQNVRRWYKSEVNKEKRNEK